MGLPHFISKSSVLNHNIQWTVCDERGNSETMWGFCFLCYRITIFSKESYDLRCQVLLITQWIFPRCTDFDPNNLIVCQQTQS